MFQRPCNISFHLLIIGRVSIHLLPLQMRILGPALIPFSPQQRSYLLSIAEPLRFDRTIRQEDTDQSADTHRHSTNRHEEDPPAGELGMDEREAIREQPAEDHRQGIADVEPRDSTSLLLFLIPHGDDQDEDGRDAAFEDAEESAADCETGERRARRMTAENQTPEHDVHAEVQTEAGDVLREVLGWEFRREEAYFVSQVLRSDARTYQYKTTSTDASIPVL